MTEIVNFAGWAWRNLRGEDREWLPPAKVRNVTTSGNVNPTDGLVRVDATSGAVTLTLETPVGADGRIHIFKLIDASGNGMTISGTVDAGSLNTTTQYDVFRIVSNGTTWDLI